MNLRHIRLLIWKEFKQLRRDPMYARLILAMPIMQLILFGYVVGVDVNNLPTAIVDLDRTPVSRSIGASFEASDYFDIVARPDSEDALKPLLDRNQAAVAIVIPSGTQASIQRGQVAGIGVIVDGSDSQTASIGTAYASRIIGGFNSFPDAGPGVDASVRVVYNQSLRTVNTMIPGLIASIMMISVLAIMSQSVVKERERGTLEQIFVTPISRGEYLVGKVVPYALLAAIQATLVAVLGTLWFRVPFEGSLAVLLTGLGLFLLTNVGIGLLVSLVSRTRQQAQQAMMFIILPTMLLSDFIFPVESMPQALQPWTKLIPMTHVMEVIRGVFVKGSGFEALAMPLLMLLGFAVTIFGVSVVLMRRRLSE